MGERVPFIDHDPQTTQTAAQLPTPRLLKTHMPYAGLPAPVEAGDGKVSCNWLRCVTVHLHLDIRVCVLARW